MRLWPLNTFYPMVRWNICSLCHDCKAKIPAGAMCYIHKSLRDNKDLLCESCNGSIGGTKITIQDINTCECENTEQTYIIPLCQQCGDRRKLVNVYE